MTIPRLLLLTMAVLLPAGVVRSGTEERPYTIADLGTIGGSSSFGVAINDAGQVAGESSFPGGGVRAFLWLPQPALGLGAGMHDLGTLGGTESIAHGLDGTGRVVGFSFVPEPMTPGRAFLWQDGTMNDLGDLGPALRGSAANGINDHGEVVGNVGLFGCRPSVWLPAARYGLPAGLSELPLPAGWSQGRANDINDHGQIVGHLNDFCATSVGDHPFLWLPEPAYGLPAGPHDLTPDALGPDFQASARAINDRGEIVGHLSENGVDLQPFLWRDGEFTFLPLPAGVISGEALAVNELGQVVGFVRLPNFSRRAVLWDDGEVHFVRDLIPPASGWELETANGINLRGQIVGSGFHGPRRAFLATPLGISPLEIPVLDRLGVVLLVLALSAGGAALLASRHPVRPRP